MLIAGDDEDVMISFGSMVGDINHTEIIEVEMTHDVLERVAAGEVTQVIFCPPGALRLEKARGKKHSTSTPVIFDRRRT